MGTVFKILIGIIIGAVGFWALQPEQEAINVGSRIADGAKPQQETLKQKQQTRANTIDEKSSSIGKKVDYKALEKDKYLSPGSNPKGIVLGEKGTGQTVAPPPEPIEVRVDSQAGKSASKYFEGIPKDYHALLDPPERRKDLPELHRDLVDEEQDINWGLAMEQQIRNFVMNHPHSNYLLDFRITCKTTMCEMMSKTPIEHTKKWSDLCNDMLKDGWWEFSGTHSSGSYVDNKKNYVNIRILTRSKKD